MSIISVYQLTELGFEIKTYSNGCYTLTLRKQRRDFNITLTKLTATLEILRYDTIRAKDIYINIESIQQLEELIKLPEIKFCSWNNKHMSFMLTYHERFLTDEGFLYKEEYRYKKINITKIKCWCCEQRRFPKEYRETKKTYSLKQRNNGTYANYYDGAGVSFTDIIYQKIVCDICLENVKAFNIPGISTIDKISYLKFNDNIRIMFKEIIEMSNKKKDNKVVYRKAKRKHL